MDLGKARSHRDGGVLPALPSKAGVSACLLRKYADSPMRGTPLINAGGEMLHCTGYVFYCKSSYCVIR